MVGSVGGTERNVVARQGLVAVAPRHQPRVDSGQIINRARDGDDDALAQLYRDHVSIVFGYLRANGCPNPEDATADVFEGMLKSIQRFNGNDDDFRRWLMTIAHHRLIDNRRRTQRRGVDQSWSEVPEQHRLAALERTGSNPDDPMAEDHELVSAIAQLTTSQRQVIGLRFIADLPIEQVADVTGRSVTGVKALQRRGLGALRRILTDEVESAAGAGDAATDDATDGGETRSRTRRRPRRGRHGLR